MPTPKAIADMRALGVLAPQSGDTQPPSIPQNVNTTAINAGRVDLSWTASTDTFGVSGYQIYRNGSPLTVVSIGTTHSDTTCEPSTAYSYTIAAFDSAGNNSQQSNAANVTTPANASPVWQSIPTQTVLVGNAYLLQLSSFCTDADLDTIAFSITAGTLPTGLVLSGTRIQGTPATAGQAPTITVQAADQFHQISTTISFSIKSPDVTAPPVPGNLAASAVGTSQINLSWSAATDVAGSPNELVSGTKEYLLYRSTDGSTYSLRTTLTGTTYSDTGLAAATLYFYKVSSRDNALNESSQSGAATATTSGTTFNPTYPRLGSYAIGGQQNYHTASVITALAKRHVNIVSHYPGWQNSKGTTLAAVTTAIKAQSTIGSKVFVYIITSSLYKAAASTGQAYWEPYNRLVTNKEFGYSNGLAETGVLTSAADPSQDETNFTLTAKVVSGKRWYQYIIDWNLGVSRDGLPASNGTTTLTAAANGNLDGFFIDNVFSKPRTNADYNRDGTPDGISSVASMQACQNSHVAAINYLRGAWPTSMVIVNSADWREYETAYGFGSFSAAPLNQQADGGAIESLELYEPLATLSVVRAIATQMNAFRTPKLGVAGWKIASFTDYQMMRFGFAIAQLTDAYYYPLVSTYRSEDLPSLRYDEDDASLGTAVDPVQTAARYQATGSLGQGVWRRSFSLGDCLFGAKRDDGATTPYASVSLGGTYWLISGTQAPTVNTGEAVSSITISPRDGRVLLKAPQGISSIFPVSIASNNRYFQTATGLPFFLNGDTPWCAITQLTDTQWLQYLDDRVTRGFNTILVELIERYFSDSAPNMITGVAPFTTVSDIRTPNEAYFNRAATMIANAGRRGVLVYMTPAYLGFSGTSEGWLSAIQARTTTECQAFCAYVGEKFKGLPNIVWVFGGDYWNSAILTRTQAMVAGLKATGRSDWLITYHTAPAASSADVVNAESWLNVNMTYEQDEAGIVTRLESDYARATTRPFFLAEAKYEQENSVTRQVLRAQGYWSVLTGGAGPGFFGNSPIWHFDGVNLPFPSYTGTWPTNLASSGSVDRTVMKNFFTSFAWHTLVPDRTGAVLTGGAGTGSARAYAARLSNGSKIVVYTPTQKSLTVAMSQLVGGSSTASWVNAQTGSVTAAGVFGVTGTQSFTPPSAGDWLLVLDGVAGSVGIVASDNFRTRSRNANSTISGSVFTSNWVPAGYQSLGGFSDTAVRLYDRTQIAALMPALISDPRVPAEQTMFLFAEQNGNEAEGMVNVDIPLSAAMQEVYISWWEARSSGSRAAGEKFMRIDTFQGTGSTLGHDNVIGRGNIISSQFNQMLLFENGPAVSPDYGEVGNAAVPWDGTLAHWETRILLSTGTSSNGVWTLWKDGVQVCSATNIKFSQTTAQAAWLFRRFTLGGWNSGSHGWEAWPIQRIFLGWRLASSRQGVWSL